jgi:hypothetical protein
MTSQPWVSTEAFWNTNLAFPLGARSALKWIGNNAILSD